MIGVKSSVSSGDGIRTSVDETSASMMVLLGKIAPVSTSVERNSKSGRDDVDIAMNT